MSGWGGAFTGLDSYELCAHPVFESLEYGGPKEHISLLLTIFLNLRIASKGLKEVQLKVGALSSLLSAKEGFRVGRVQRRGSWPDASWGRLQNP